MENESLQFMTELEDENSNLKEQIRQCKFVTEKIDAQKEQTLNNLRKEYGTLKAELVAKEKEYKSIFGTLRVKAAKKKQETPKWFGPIEDLDVDQLKWVSKYLLIFFKKTKFWYFETE